MSTPSSFCTDAATVPLAAGRALLMVDADEVLLAFARGFGRFLEERGFYLDLVSYRLYGNVRRRDDNSALLDIEVTGLLDEFRTELDWLDAVEGARETVASLRDRLDVVVVSNVSPAQAPARLRNLASLGLSAPLLANSGPKGPAIQRLARRAGEPSFFIDDIPMHHASVAELAPEVWRIHYVGDERLRPLMKPSAHAHLWAETWPQIDEYIRERM